MRALGTNSIDNAARVCHSPSTFGLSRRSGVARHHLLVHRLDRLGPDRLHRLERRQQPAGGDEVPAQGQGGRRARGRWSTRTASPAWSATGCPSIPESALFGTKIADRFFDVDVGGDVAFLTGTLKHMVERGWVDARVRRAPHERLRRARAGARRAADWERARARLGRRPRGDARLRRAARARRARAVFVWSMGVTQHDQRRGQRARDRQPRAWRRASSGARSAA